MTCQGPGLEWLSKQYYEQNGNRVTVLSEPPSSLEFSRLVRISRPVKVNGFRIPASADLWSKEYLVQKLGGRPISIAVTPNGQADAVTKAPGEKFYFVEPYVEKMLFSEFLSRLQESREVCYLQSQNGNVYSSKFFDDPFSDPSEFEPLRSDIPCEIPWCTQAFGRKPDAVNLWIGDHKSVTSIHCDPYENIYTVVRGEKHFTLLPPTDGCYLDERLFPHATYTRPSPSSLQITPSSQPPVRWSSITDPGKLSSKAHPIDIVLNAGETLYLPAGWWHYVRQASELTVALNWWYDVDMEGMTWVVLNFLRGIADSASEGSDDDD